MDTIPIDSRTLKEYINRGETYQWVLPRDDVSGTLHWIPGLGFYIPCGEEPGEEPSRVMDRDILEYHNNGNRVIFMYHEGL